MKFKLSIITINYNDREGLKNTMNSVFEQTFCDYEYIIIDGNSTDGSKELIEANESKINFWISEPDKGIYNAMNKGIKRSNGEYLLFLNSGDCLTTDNILENFVQHKNFKGDIIYGDYKFTKGEKVFPNTLTPLFFMKSSLPHQSTFIKKKLFSDIGYYNENYKIVSDREFFIKCFLSKNFKFKHINIFLTLFDMKGISNSKLHSFTKEKEDSAVLKDNFGKYYIDYLYLLKLESNINALKKNTIKGFFKRVISKIKFYAKTSS